MVDERDASAFPLRRPLAAPVITVQQARVCVAFLQIHPVHALHAGSSRPMGITLLHLHRALPLQSPSGAGCRDVLRSGVPRRTVAHRSRADKDHELMGGLGG